MGRQLESRTVLRCLLFLQLCAMLVTPFLHGTTSAIVAPNVNNVVGGATPTDSDELCTKSKTDAYSTIVSSSKKKRGRQPDAFRQWFATRPTDESADDGLSSISLGAPRSRPENGNYISPIGITVSRHVLPVDDVATEIKRLVEALDDTKGAILTSSYEYPGRYARWTVGFISPPLFIEGIVTNSIINHSLFSSLLSTSNGSRALRRKRIELQDQSYKRSRKSAAFLHNQPLSQVTRDFCIRC